MVWQQFSLFKCIENQNLLIDRKKTNIVPTASTISGEDVHIVDSYKYLATVFDSQLKFNVNTESEAGSTKKSSVV